VNARVEREQHGMLEASTAVSADVRSGIRVRTFVVGARAGLGEARRAALDTTPVRFLSGMGAHVDGQRRRRATLASTLTAHVRRPVTGCRRHARSGGSSGAISASVRSTLMHLQQGRVRELSVAQGTRVVTHSLFEADTTTLLVMRLLMSHQVTHMSERLAAYTAWHHLYSSRATARCKLLTFRLCSIDVGGLAGVYTSTGTGGSGGHVNAALTMDWLS